MDNESIQQWGTFEPYWGDHERPYNQQRDRTDMLDKMAEVDHHGSLSDEIKQWLQVPQSRGDIEDGRQSKKSWKETMSYMDWLTKCWSQDIDSQDIRFLFLSESDELIGGFPMKAQPHVIVGWRVQDLSSRPDPRNSTRHELFRDYEVTKSERPPAHIPRTAYVNLGRLKFFNRLVAEKAKEAFRHDKGSFAWGEL